MKFEHDDKNYYFFGKPDLKDEKYLIMLGFYYDHNEFDDRGNKFEVWIRERISNERMILYEG